MPVRDFHPLWRAFPDASSSQAPTVSRSYNPGHAVTSPVWALSRSLTTTWEIIVIFSSSDYLDVSVHRVCLLFRITTVPGGWVAPFGHPRIKRLFAPPRGFSQLITSFFASESQGIPRTLLVTYSFFYSIFFFVVSLAVPVRTAAKLF